MASRCRQMRGSISYQQPSTVSGEAHMPSEQRSEVEARPFVCRLLQQLFEETRRKPRLGGEVLEG